MKRQKLYIKNDKGRYEEFRPDMKSEDSDLLFRKIRGKYVPVNRRYEYDSLSEGVCSSFQPLLLLEKHD